jgi:beta-glucosidase-like glycosyl hydrolase
VTQGHVAAVMCAYPFVNDAFACENKDLLTDVLRNQWGFTGFVQSDASATHTAVGSADAGQDLELRDNGPYDEELRQAVVDGRVSMSTLDRMIVRRLVVEIRAGLFDHPRTITPIDAVAGGKVARRVAEQSAVLLKNTANQLPLSTPHSIAVIGPFAEAVHPGGGGSSHVNPLYTVSPVDGVRRRAGDDLVGHLDYPMLIVTVSDGRRRAGCLIGFASQCSIDPPLHRVWLSKNNYTYTVANGCHRLAVHVLTPQNRSLAELFGTVTGSRRTSSPGARGRTARTACRC